MKNKSKQMSFRFNDETIKQLDELCEVYSRNRTQVLEMLVFGDYHKTTEKGKQKMKEMTSTFDLVNKQLSTMLEGIK